MYRDEEVRDPGFGRCILLRPSPDIHPAAACAHYCLQACSCSSMARRSGLAMHVLLVAPLPALRALTRFSTSVRKYQNGTYDRIVGPTLEASGKPGSSGSAVQARCQVREAPGPEQAKRPWARLPMDGSFHGAHVIALWSQAFELLFQRGDCSREGPAQKLWGGTRLPVQLLDSDGISAVGEAIRPGDIYVNKQSPSNTRDPVLNPMTLPDV